MSHRQLILFGNQYLPRLLPAFHGRTAFPHSRPYLPHSGLRQGHLRSLSTSLASWPAVNNDSNTEAESEVDTFGNYSVILPPEPFVFGVSHITPRPVPRHIVRPPYASSVSSSHDETGSTKALTSGNESASDATDGRIILGSKDERCLRRAAALAKRVLEYAGSLVKVIYSLIG